jgi:hypothetical protein
MIHRKHQRFTVTFPISFTGDHTGDGDVTDLSLGGCRVENADTTVHADAVLTLRLILSYKDDPLKVDAAIVRWSFGDTFGLEFLSFAPNEEDRLQKYLQKLSL